MLWLIGIEVPAMSVALFGAVAYGGGDFMGGRAALRLSAPGAVAIAQCIAMLVAVQALMVGQMPVAFETALLPGLLGGLAYAIGLLRLYQGIAHGRIGVVAPVCGVVGILVPMLGDFALSREITANQFGGIALCAIAIVMLSATRELDDTATDGPSSFRLGVESGLGYGAADLCLGMVEPQDGLAALTIARSVAAFIAVALLVEALRRSPFAHGRRSARGGVNRMFVLACALAACAGIFDSLGHMSYVHVATQGSMAVASAVVALFPAVVVMLAVVVLRETISGLQWFGLGASMAGITLICS